MAKQTKLKSVFRRFDDIDYDKPYKVTCPELHLSPKRFASLELAIMAMDEAKENGHQAILTYANITDQKIVFKAYIAPNWRFRRRTA
ncbi:hypothetical protein ACS126_01625 [Sphingobacterium lactis]|uniref:hypothetical protein n=1 Tax=Sphingobacterium lactis TaxID=797291 RepID=UPI003EC5A938